MPATIQRRLAGFRFETQPPPLPESLPRMDIAALVGFASAGPLDLPVVVEDIKRFDDLFGDDLKLAWDNQRSELVVAHLSAAVRDFLQNGGKRCWIIRVAGPAESDVFSIPGLAEVTPDGLKTAWAVARSPGSWFDAFACATAIEIAGVEAAAAPDIDFNRVFVRLGTRDTLAPGDLLRLTWSETSLEGVELFLSVTGLSLQTESPPTSGRRRFAVNCRPLCAVQASSLGEYSGRFCEIQWSQNPTESSPVRVSGLVDLPSPVPNHQASLIVDGGFQPPPGTLLQLTVGGEALWLIVDDVRAKGDASTPMGGTQSELLGRAFRKLESVPDAAINRVPVIQIVTFELDVRRGDIARLPLTDLGFTRDHPRFWGALPSDAQLFYSTDFQTSVERASAQPYTELWSEAASPRFPVAGRGPGSFIPLGMGALAEPFLSAGHSARTPGERDGWPISGPFTATAFLDAELSDISTADLMAEADFIRYKRPNPRTLLGIHAALAIEEATLIAVPDAIHRGWYLTAPNAGPSPQPSEPLPHPDWGLTDDCTSPVPDPIPSASGPRWDKFLNCDLRVLHNPTLALNWGPDILGTFLLDWTSIDTDVEFILEEAREPDFSDTVPIYRGVDSERTLYGRPKGQYYYRVRSVSNSETSNWSNALAVWVQPPSRWSLNAEEEFNWSAVLDVHRALLRLCAARGDLMAVLALPEHFRESETLAYLDRLQGGATDDGGNSDALTPPLSTGEAQALTYGAVYHPWVIGSGTDLALRRTPPDGTATGVIARRSLDRGAWIAPANQPWRGVLGLSPLLNPANQLDLLLAQLNQVRQEPTGFLTLNADTLGRGDYADLRPINVRRLLMLLRRAALKLGMNYVFEPNGEELRRQVRRSFESLLDQLFVRGAFAGATRAESYQLVTDDSINTPQRMDEGQFRIDIKVAPSLPLSFITVRLVQTGERSLATEIL